MASLADTLQSRHLEQTTADPAGSPTTGAPTPGNAAGPGVAADSLSQAAAETSETSEVPEPAAELASTAGANAAADSSATAKPAPVAAKPAVDLSRLPQLKSSGARGNAAAAPKWGEPVASSATASGASSASASPAISRLATPQGVRVPASSVVITECLDTPSDPAAISEAVKLVSQTQKVVIEVSKAAVPNKATFMIKGSSTKIVEAARSLLETHLAPKVAKTVRIPASARSALIGVRGAVLRGLEREHSVSIDLSNQSASAWSLGFTLVTIEGSAPNVARAERAVQNVVDTQRQVASTRKLDPKLHKFLLANDMWGALVSPSAPHVTVQGNLAEVLAKMAELDALLGEWEQTYESLPLPVELVERATQDEIVVPTDLLLSDLNVLVLPDYAVYGPPKQLAAAVERVKSYLASQSSVTIDISQAHQQDLAHARLLSRYFVATNLLKELSAEHSVSIRGPDLESGVTYRITGPERSTALVRKILVREVKELTPTAIAVVRGMRFPLVRKQAQQAVKELTGPVSGLVGPSDELYLLYTEPEDDFSPKEADIRRHMDAALAKLAPLMSLAKNIVKKTCDVGENNAQFLVKPLGADAQQLAKEVTTNHGGVDIQQETPSSVVLTGVKAAVAEAAGALNRIVQLSRTYAVRSSHIEEFSVDPTIVGNLIGRQGSQIQALRTKHDVKLEIDENGHVHVQGVEKNTKACAKEILEMQRRLRDETTENLVIPVIYHPKLIGSRGKHVRRLRETHQCIIRFPQVRQGSQEAYSDEDSTVYSESNSVSGSTNVNNEDVIFIRGPSRGVAAIKKEFLDLVAYERSQSYTETFKVKSAIVPRIVGRGGLAINSIRNHTNTKINVGTADGEDDVDITVIGERKSVESAVAQIKQAAATAADMTEVTLEVDTQLHRLLVGAENSARRELVSKAGGDPEQATRTMIVGVNGPESPLVRLTGPSAVVSKLKDSVLAIIDEYKQRLQVSSPFTFPRDRLRFLLGPGGAKRRSIEEKFNVFIQIPNDVPRNARKPVSKKTTTGTPVEEDTVTVTVQGESEKLVNDVIQNLRQLVLPSSLNVEIAAPAWSSRIRSSMLSKFGVRADLVTKNAVAPLADEPSAPFDGSEWVVKTIDTKAIVEIQGESPETCEKAANFLKENCVANTYGYLWVPQSKHRAIIGQGGKTINKLRHQSKAAIEVPSSVKGANNKPIVIVGDAKQVEAAKALILEAAADN